MILKQNNIEHLMHYIILLLYRYTQTVSDREDHLRQYNTTIIF